MNESNTARPALAEQSVKTENSLLNRPKSDSKFIDDDDMTEYQKIPRPSRKIDSTPFVIAPDQPSNPIKSGFLSKKGRANFIRPWSLRKIIIDDQYRLFYYDRNLLKGVVPLHGAGVRHVSVEKSNNRSFTFEIHNINDTKSTRKKKSLLLAAGSQAEANEWVETIKLLLQQLIQTKNIKYESFEVTPDIIAIAHTFVFAYL